MVDVVMQNEWTKGSEGGRREPAEIVEIASDRIAAILDLHQQLQGIL